MKIFFLEVQDWEKEPLENAFPEAVFSDQKMTAENAAGFAKAEILSTFIYSSLDRETLDKLPNLKFIATRSTGFDHIDISLAKTKNILVSNVPEYGSHTVAEHTFALILNLTRKICRSVKQVGQDGLNRREIRGIDLYGKTLGILGLGKIGRAVLDIAKGFGMNLLVSTRAKDEVSAQKLGFKYAALTELLEKSDIVSLHLPYTPETHHIINKENILKMKKGGYLVNTARGGLIETQALIIGLEQGILEGVGLDVLEEENTLAEELEILASGQKEKVNYETLLLDHLLINHPKVIITPHNAFNSQEALNRITATTIENIKAFLAGNLLNTVTATS